MIKKILTISKYLSFFIWLLGSIGLNILILTLGLFNSFNLYFWISLINLISLILFFILPDYTEI
jgi:hypothetical protein